MGVAFCKKLKKQKIKKMNNQDKISELLMMQNNKIIIDNRGEIHEVSEKLINQCKYQNIFQDNENKEFFVDINTKNFEFILQIIRSFQIDFSELIEEGYFERKLNFIPNIYNLKKDIRQIFPNSYSNLLKDFQLEKLFIRNKFDLIKSVELENSFSNDFEGIEKSKLSNSLEEFRNGKDFIIKNGFLIFKFERAENIQELIFFPSKYLKKENFRTTEIYIKHSQDSEFLKYCKYDPKYDFDLKDKAYRLFLDDKKIISVMIKTSKNNIFSLGRIDFLY